MKRILCYGDSNTWGLVPGTKDRYPACIRWTGLLRDQLRSRDISLAEEGLCGRTTMFEDPYRVNRNGLKTLPGILTAGWAPDGAVIMLGTNDCKPCYGADPSVIAGGMGQCVDVLAGTVPRENILVVSPPRLGPLVWQDGYDPEFDRASVEKSQNLYQAYRKEADRKRVRLLDADRFVRVSGADQEHLTPEGHAALAEAVYRALFG